MDGPEDRYTLSFDRTIVAAAAVAAAVAVAAVVAAAVAAVAAAADDDEETRRRVSRRPRVTVSVAKSMHQSRRLAD